MESPQLSFDQWAQAIGSRVLEAFPQVCAKRKLEDVYRWTYGERECQLHAVSDGTATFVALNGELGWGAARKPETVRVTGDTQAELVRRIIGWLGR
jgi:hypothetical protein